MRDVELLAPAGNFDGLRAAVTNGANAVYLGLGRYSARAKAANFGVDEFRAAVEYAHLFGVKVYVALNTLIKDSEFSDAINSAKAAYEAGADAFIVQDLGLLLELKKILPYAEIHASTQMGAHNKEGTKILEELGVKRVILSRETRLDDIAAIRAATNLEIECFVHGALCIAFSGNCYFSGLISGNSGNRGQCLQFCRKKYTLECANTKKSGFMLSAKDLMLIDELDKLIGAGVDSFKIEGRMRRAAYVGETVRVYRNAINCLSESRKNVELKRDVEKLKSMFNRGDYCTAHLLEPTADVVYPYVNGHTGLRIGKVEQIFGEKAAIRSEKNLKSGDGIKFIRDKTEVGSAAIASDSNITGFSGNVKKGDDVYLTTDSTLIKEIESRKRFLSVSARVRFKIGEPAVMTLLCGGTEISVKSTENIDRAVKAPMSKERICEIITSQSDEIFAVTVDNCEIDDNIFVPVGAIKALKRAALEKLSNAMLEKNGKKVLPENSSNITTNLFSGWNYNEAKSKQTFIQVESLDSAKALEKFDGEIEYYVLNPKVYNVEAVENFAQKYGNRAVLNLPNVARGEDIDVLRRIVSECRLENFIANNLYAFELCRGKNVLAGFMLNSMNGKLRREKIVSPEIGRFDNNSVNYVFGKLPLMTFCHCAKKNLTANGCAGCNGYDDASLKDGFGNEFPLRRYKIKHCYTSLLNSLPVFLTDKANENKTEKKFIDFTGYSPKEISDIAECVINGTKPLFDYTRGYYNKKLR